MTCRLSDFDIGEWKTLQINGHTVELAEATSKPLPWLPADAPGTVPGVVYKVDGTFQGFTGSEDAVRYWVNQRYPVEPVTSRSDLNVTEQELVFNPQWDRYVGVDKPLFDRMAEAGFSPEHTGGGCMGWYKPLDDGGSISISFDSALGDLDSVEVEAWYVGRDDANGDAWVQCGQAVTLDEALRIALLLPAPDTASPERDIPKDELLRD